MKQSTTSPHIPVSWGELVDKLSILEIKKERLTDKAARSHVRQELNMLLRIARPFLAQRLDVLELAAWLKVVNEALWEIEERIRKKEQANQFDSEFIELARSIYRRNDERADLKRKISLLLNSEILEEKSY